MKGLFILLCCLLFATESFSQAGNLVPNGDFEEGSAPDCVGQADNDHINNWESNVQIRTDNQTGNISRYHSPDLYQVGVVFNPNECASFPPPTGGAYSGNRSIGMGGYEIIETNIGTTLVPGKYYTLSFYIQPEIHDFSVWSGTSELKVKLSRQRVDYQDCLGPPISCDYEDFECESNYVTHVDGSSQEFFELASLDLDIDNFVEGEWQRVSYTFRADEQWYIPATNKAKWLSFEVRQKNYNDPGSANVDCYDDFVHIDNVRIEEATFCHSQCSPSLNPITYSTDPVNYNSTLPNGMTAEGYAIVNGNYLTPFTLYVKDAMGIDLAIYDDQWQNVLPLVTISAFDPNGLIDVGYNDYQFFWDGQLPDGSFLPNDTYFYTIRLWSCVNDLFIVHNIQYLVSNTTYMDVPNIINYELINCCDDFVVYNNVSFGSDFRKDVTDYIIAGDTGPVIVQSGTEVEFYAGNEITLGPNFYAAPGSDFTAYLQDCIYGPRSLESTKLRIEHHKDSTHAVKNLSDQLDEIRIVNSLTNDGFVGFKIIGGSEIKNIKILDIGGNKIDFKQLSMSEGKIDFSNVSNGVYFIIFETTSGYVSTKKIVVSK